MGNLTLLPADPQSLAAFYDSTRKMLILYANGKAPAITTDIHFSRDRSFVGGLKYNLMGWTFAILPPRDQPFDIQTRDAIVLPSPVLPSNTVILSTSNNPSGWVVPIKYGGFIETFRSMSESNGSVFAAPPKTAMVTAASDNPGPTNQAVPSLEHRNEIIGFPFTIKESADASPNKTIQVNFEETYLSLKDAGLKGSNLFWTFDSHKVGETEIHVSGSSTNPPFMWEEIYHVTIREIGPGLTAAPAPVEEIDRSFLARVKNALAWVKEQGYQEPKLADATARPNHPGGASHVLDLANIECTFRAKKDGEDGRVTTESIDWGQFSTPKWDKGLFVGPLSVPLEHLIDDIQAEIELRKKGYLGKFNKLELRDGEFSASEESLPLEIGPNYGFYMVSPPKRVSINAKQVWTEESK